MRLIQFGSVTLPENDGADSLPVQARSSLVMLPNGSFDQDGGQLVLMPGSVSRQARIFENADTVFQNLLKEMSKGRMVLKALLRDNTTEWQTWAKMQAVQRTPVAATYDCDDQIIMQFALDYPYWLASVDEPFYFDMGELFDDGLFFDGGNVEEQVLNATTENFTINNTGGAAVPRGTVTILPQTSASITNPRITNAANNLYLQYTGTVTDADQLVIDFLTKTIRLNGTDVYSDLSIDDSQMDWMVLELGENDIEVTASAITGDVDLKWAWSRHYL